MTYRQAGQEASHILQAAGITEYAVDAAFLLREVSGFDMTRSLLYADEEIPAASLERYREMIRRRADREPLQHITGHQTFMGYDFRTGPQALIPRQDTEVLVTEALQFLRENRSPAQQLRVYDVCTGTGCIAVSMALEFPGPEYCAVDISEEALELAERNARVLGVPVHFFRGDLLSEAEGTFDLIVSNPPYIPDDVIQDLDPEVRDHDPLLALSGGVDGLEIYRRLIPQAYGYLKEGGALMLEIGADQAADVCGLLRLAGFSGIRVLQDPSGHDRVITAVRRSAGSTETADCFGR